MALCTLLHYTNQGDMHKNYSIVDHFIFCNINHPLPLKMVTVINKMYNSQIEPNCYLQCYAVFRFLIRSIFVSLFATIYHCWVNTVYHDSCG